MKLTYLTWGYPHDDKIIRAFEATGIEVEKKALPSGFFAEGEEEPGREADGDAHQELKAVLRSAEGDMIFSVNFFAAVSDFCREEGLAYCSWVLALPNHDLYTRAVMNSCNYIGICDSYLVEKLMGIGVGKVFLLPDAVEVCEREKQLLVERGVCFVGSRPKEQLFLGKMSLYNQGYIESFLHIQRVLHGAYILENGLLGPVQQELMNVHPAPQDILPEFRKLYVADYHLAPSVTCLQQNIILQNFNNLMTVYSDDDFSAAGAECHPYPTEEEERRWIYSSKEFTLVLAPHALHYGIPRQLLEVIIAGGFPLSGFQRDFNYFFRQNENLAFFRDRTEFQRAVVRYGNDQGERKRVQQAAYETVLRQHTYANRIESMLAMWSQL